MRCGLSCWPNEARGVIATRPHLGLAPSGRPPNTIEVDVKSRILRALVASAVGERPRKALDLTRQGTAARALVSMGVDCRRIPIAQELYGLVVCTMSTLPRVLPLVQAEGSLIVHIKPGQHGDLLGMAGEFGLVASARTPTGAWLQLRRLGDVHAVAPRVSVVVSPRNDAGALAQLLATLEDQPTDPAWEIVVVDRGSTDATTDLLQTVTGDLRRIRVARDADAVDATYAGLRAARGDLILPLAVGLAPGCGFVSALLRYADHNPPSAEPLLGSIVALDGRQVPGGVARVFARAFTPTTPRRLAKWLTRTDGVVVPGFRVRQLVAGPTPSIGRLAESLDGSAQAEAHAILTQSR